MKRDRHITSGGGRDTGVGVALGISIGLALGIILDTMVLWTRIGLALRTVAKGTLGRRPR
jgi:hypothetical protein